MKAQTIEAWVEAAGAALGLEIDEHARPGVLRYFELAAGFAAIVEAVALSPHDEAATTFVPVAPLAHPALDADGVGVPELASAREPSVRGHAS